MNDEIIAGLSKKDVRLLVALSEVPKHTNPRIFWDTVREFIIKQYRKAYTCHSLQLLGEKLKKYSLVDRAISLTKLGARVLARLKQLATDKIGAWAEYFLPSKTPNVNHEQLA